MTHDPDIERSHLINDDHGEDGRLASSRLQFSLASLFVVMTWSAVFVALCSYFSDALIGIAWAVPLVYYARALRVALEPLWPTPTVPQQRSQTTASVRIRTPISTLESTVALGGFGTLVLGGFMALACGLGGIRGNAFVLFPTIWAIGGGATGASLAGLVALLYGSTLGRYYSCVFGVAIGWLFGAVHWMVFEELSLDWFAVYLSGIILGGILGMILARSTAGFSRWSRRCAGIGTILAVPFGLLVMQMFLGWQAIHGGAGSVAFSLGVMIVAVAGGIIGAIYGVLMNRGN